MSKQCTEMISTINILHWFVNWHEQKSDSIRLTFQGIEAWIMFFRFIELFCTRSIFSWSNHWWVLDYIVYLYSLMFAQGALSKDWGSLENNRSWVPSCSISSSSSSPDDQPPPLCRLLLALLLDATSERACLIASACNAVSIGIFSSSGVGETTPALPTLHVPP